MSPAESVKARFDFRRIVSDPSGYYYDRWDKDVVSVSVIAETESEARKKAWALSGPPPRRYVWKMRLDRIHESSVDLPTIRAIDGEADA